MNTSGKNLITTQVALHTCGNAAVIQRRYTQSGISLLALYA